jgi:hypothetical protein
LFRHRQTTLVRTGFDFLTLKRCQGSRKNAERDQFFRLWGFIEAGIGLAGRGEVRIELARRLEFLATDHAARKSGGERYFPAVYRHPFFTFDYLDIPRFTAVGA